MENYSHSSSGKSVETIVQDLKQQMPQHAAILDQMAIYPLWRFLIQRGGLNGYWTHYIVTHPERKHEGTFEDIALSELPIACATQQRYQIFRMIIQSYIKEGAVFASIPCGLMGELLTLDYSHIKRFKLVGIDLDEEALSQAKEYACALKKTATFEQADAWNLPYEKHFHLIASNGLNIYVEANKQKTLFEQFYKALKPEGVLVASFLTSPNLWDQKAIKPSGLELQKIMFSELITPKFQYLQSEAEIHGQLTEIGFKEITFHYDHAHIFPTLVAKRSLRGSK